MIVDIHVHVGKSIFGYELTPEALLQNMERTGIDYSVLCPVQPFDYHLGPENDYMAEVVARHPQQLTALCRVDPRQGGKAIEEIRRAIGSLGLRGVFLHPWEEGYRVNSDAVVAVARTAGELGVPVMVSTGYPWLSHPLQVADLARQAQDTTIVMTNGGQINISGLAQMDAFTAMERQENLLVETAGVYRQDFLERVVQTFGAHRLLFGSNAPRMHQAFERDRALSATKSDLQDQDLVLGGNAIDLFKIR